MTLMEIPRLDPSGDKLALTQYLLVLENVTGIARLRLSSLDDKGAPSFVDGIRIDTSGGAVVCPMSREDFLKHVDIMQRRNTLALPR